MKAVKIILVALVIVAALFFIYMKVAWKKPVDQAAQDAAARLRLEQAVLAFPEEVDPERRKRLEDAVRAIPPTGTSTLR